MSNGRAVLTIAAAVLMLAGAFYAGYSIRTGGGSFLADLTQVANPSIPVSSTSSSSGAVNATPTTTTTTTTTSSNPTDLTEGQATTTTTEYKRTDYLIFENVDLCKIKVLGDQGWQIFQMGAVVEFPGRDTDCQTRSNAGVDWAVFSRDRNYNVVNVSPGQ